MSPPSGQTWAWPSETPARKPAHQVNATAHHGAVSDPTFDDYEPDTDDSDALLVYLAELAEAIEAFGPGDR